MFIFAILAKEQGDQISIQIEEFSSLWYKDWGVWFATALHLISISLIIWLMTW